MQVIDFLISKEYTTKPGPRKASMGKHSGEEFYNTRLKQLFDNAKTESKKYKIIFDGLEGINTGFIDESFGKLAREVTPVELLKYIDIVWKSNKFLESKIKDIIDGK